MTGPAGAPAGGRASSAPLLGHDAEPTLFELSRPGRSPGDPYRAVLVQL